jgi:hypothetical protein
MPRQPNVLKAILRAYFDDLATLYESQYARSYGRFPSGGAGWSGSPKP